MVSNDGATCLASSRREYILFGNGILTFVDKIPSWLQLPRISENAHLANAHPDIS